MDASALEELGITPTEAKIYVTLLDLGETSTGPLKERTNIHNSVVYNALTRLLEQGLVTFIYKGKTKLYSAAPPQQLIRIMKDKQSKVSELATQLQQRNIHTSTQNAQAYTGWRGIRNAFNYLLDNLPKGSEYLAFGFGVEEQFSDDTKKLFKEIQKKRSLMNYRINILLNETARAQIQQVDYYEGFGNPTFRYVEGYAPIGIIIFQDHIMHLSFSEQPLAVIIRCKEIANSQRNTFYALWKHAKE